MRICCCECAIEYFVVLMGKRENKNGVIQGLRNLTVY